MNNATNPIKDPSGHNRISGELDDNPTDVAITDGVATTGDMKDPRVQQDDHGDYGEGGDGDSQVGSLIRKNGTRNGALPGEP